MCPSRKQWKRPNFMWESGPSRPAHPRPNSGAAYARTWYNGALSGGRAEKDKPLNRKLPQLAKHPMHRNHKRMCRVNTRVLRMLRFCSLRFCATQLTDPKRASVGHLRDRFWPSYDPNSSSENAFGIPTRLISHYITGLILPPDTCKRRWIEPGKHAKQKSADG